MNAFSYVAVTQTDQARAERNADANGAFLGGGTNLIDYMKLGVEQPHRLIDINGLPLNRIEPLSGGGLRIGEAIAQFRSRLGRARFARSTRCFRRRSWLAQVRS